MRSSWLPWLWGPTPLLPTPPTRGASSAEGGNKKSLWLVFYVYWNKLLKFLKATQTYLTVPGVRSSRWVSRLRSRCWQVCVPSGGSRVQSFYLPFQSEEATHIPWLRALLSWKPAMTGWVFTLYHFNLSSIFTFFFTASFTYLFYLLHWANQIIQNNLSIWKSTYSKI